VQMIVNVHCHLVNFEFVPDSFFKVRARVREKLLRTRFAGWLARLASGLIKLFRGTNADYVRLHEVLALVRRDIRGVAETLAAEMELPGLPDTEIVLATPLMMDLEQASLNVRPECPYLLQILLMSDIAARYPGTLMPFVMVDPRRPGAAGLVQKALEELGFLGVKMYPPLGYHPDPNSVGNGRAVSAELSGLYDYCQDQGVPITTHCSGGGAYSAELVRSRSAVSILCEPAGWAKVLQQYPALRLNFAHFGGREGGSILNRYAYDHDSWCQQIADLVQRYENVYADVAYHDEALRARSAEAYFCNLEDMLRDERLASRALFGTDWPMTRHTWTEEEYVRPFLRRLPAGLFQRLAFENPLDFLFPGRRLPARIGRFLAGRPGFPPPWMNGHIQTSAASPTANGAPVP